MKIVYVYLYLESRFHCIKHSQFSVTYSWVDLLLFAHSSMQGNFSYFGPKVTLVLKLFNMGCLQRREEMHKT